MANLLFKRGPHQNLMSIKSSGNVIDGAFYLTDDTHRLYAGIGTDLVDLNQYIQIVADLAALGNLSNVEIGDFVYVEDGNILAVYKEGANLDGTSGWVQINPNTVVKKLLVNNSTVLANGELTGIGDDSLLTIAVNTTDNKTFGTSVKFVGEHGVDIATNSQGQVTITGCDYELGGTFTDTSDGRGKITLALDPSKEDVEGSEVVIQAGKNVTFSETDDVLTISADDTTLANNGHSFTTEQGTGKATVTFKDSNEKSYSAVAEEGSFSYTYGVNNTKTAYNRGKLEVYTAEEVDELFAGLNPMKYLGPVYSVDELTGKTDVRVGDTYMAAATFDIKSLLGVEVETSCVVGDLFIATGEEENGIITKNLQWTYIPSGDDAVTDTTYAGAMGEEDGDPYWKLINKSGGVGVVGVKFKGDASIDVQSAQNFNLDSSGGIKGLTLTFKHNAPGAASASVAKPNTTAQKGFSFDAVSGITTDATGHVSEYVLQRFQIPQYRLTSTSAAVSGNIATVTTSLQDTEGVTTQALFKVDASAEDSLFVDISNTDTQGTVKLSLQWGTF